MIQETMKRIYWCLLTFCALFVFSGCSERNAVTPAPATDELQKEPLPSYLSVLPEPGDSLTRRQFRNLAWSTGRELDEPAICVGVDPGGTMEAGDPHQDESWLSVTHIIIDNQRIDDYSYLDMTESSGREYFDPENGEYLYTAPDGSPFVVCYVTELKVGRHEVTYVIEQTSGNILEYTWAFEIARW